MLVSKPNGQSRAPPSRIPPPNELPLLSPSKFPLKDSHKTTGFPVLAVPETIRRAYRSDAGFLTP